jgi:predicted outer membrane protein
MRRYIILFMLLLTACGTTATEAPPAAAPTAAPVAAADLCGGAALQAYRRSYNEIVGRWGTAVVQAGAVSSADLQQPIGELQKLIGELAAVTPPTCAQPAHIASVEAMRTTLRGYQDLFAQKNVGATILNGVDLLADAQLRINALPGLPAPTPTDLPTNTPVPTVTPAPTFTPRPTNTPTATPLPTATAEPRKGVLSSKAQVYETAISLNPVKTLLKGTPVLVFEAMKGRIHIRAGDVEGWVPQGAVLIN